MERPFWLIKALSITFKEAIKNKKEGFIISMGGENFMILTKKILFITLLY